jgi:hypothetical protein
MPEARLYVTLFVAVLLSTQFAAAAGAEGRPGTAATNDWFTRQPECTDGRVPQPCQQGTLVSESGIDEAAIFQQERNGSGRPGQTTQPSMSATASRTGSNGFRVSVRNARNGQSATVDPPSDVGDTGIETDLRGLRVVSRGGTSSFDLDYTVDRDLSTVSSGSPSSPPEAFATALFYTTFQTAANDRVYDVAYDFDVENEFLREYDANRDDIVVATYRRGSWETISPSSRDRSGNETVVTTPPVDSQLIAVGLRHANLSVTGLEPRTRPVLSNRSSRLELSVANSGSRNGTRRFEIAANDRSIGIPSVSVPAGGQRTVTVPVRFQRPGETDVEVGEYETRINVTQPEPDISVTRLSVEPTRIETGETVTVTAEVTNNGTAKGTGTARFSAFGDAVTSKQVRLAPGESRTVQFTQPFDAAGEYQVGVNGRTAAVTVEGSPNQASTRTAGPGPEQTDDGSDSDDLFQWGLILLGAGVVLLFSIGTVGRILWR